jgi:hypothetical protein
VNLLNLAARIDSKQLAGFLRHFFCVNYVAVSQRPDFAQLDKENREYILEHQWPPKSYFKEVEAYEKQRAAWLKRNGKKDAGPGFFSKLFSSSSAATAAPAASVK